MQPDWPSLWEREPRLRPECLLNRVHRKTSWKMRAVVGGTICVPAEVAAALCRDAAVMWLTCGDVPDTARITGPEGSERAIVTIQSLAGQFPADDNWIDEQESHWTSFYGPTLDTALFAACAAVLDARDAAKPHA